MPGDEGAGAPAARQRSRSPHRRWQGLRAWWQGSAQGPPTEAVEREKPEGKMHLWAAKSGQTDETRVKELMDTMEIADFEKYKMCAVFTCPPDQVAEKLTKELQAKKLPEKMIKAVVQDVGGIVFYEKSDSQFDHSCSGAVKGKSSLYEYAVWCAVDSRGLMDVSVRCITALFTKGSKGPATKREIEGLKQFMEQETRADVLQLAARRPLKDSPGACMVDYAMTMFNTMRPDIALQDELINRMQITGFQKYNTNSSFQCPKQNTVDKVRSELEAKMFPPDVVQAVTEGLADMATYKKMDENFWVHANDGKSNYYKYAIWCSEAENDTMQVSLMCTSASFKKKAEGPVTKSEIEVLGKHLSNEACTDVLRVHAPHALQ